MQRIVETDEVGRPTATYIPSAGNGKPADRVDMLPASQTPPHGQRLLSVFLPTGYPHTVSGDYTPYQIYDSLQAFSSSIAGLLASRAVLQGIGVGDENASATAVMLLSVLQESVGRIATIIFAHWRSRSIEVECKMYRLAADVFNDIAMILDCCSPMLPKPFRVPFFCASSVFRTMCGVAGGSSKAILSSHFAKADNIGELNAKDSSQETVISLLGMWAGGFVISNITSAFATWTWLLMLLAVHLSTNYAAVRSVTMRTLNRQRANIVFSALMEGERLLTPEDASKQEFVFEKDGVLRWQGRKTLGTCEIGLAFRDMLQAIGGQVTSQTGSFKHLSISLSSLLDIFVTEQYILWFNPVTEKAVIALKDRATTISQLKAWSHALRVARICSKAKMRKMDLSPQAIVKILEDTQRTHNITFERHIKQLEDAGWNTSTAALETNPGRRICVEEHKKPAQL
jgi:Vitamin B6 photo-protection and homoeostasis